MPDVAATTYPKAAIDTMLAAVQFDAQGLVPAIAQQHGTGEVLMMAPDALTLMGITNGGRDIPARQIAEGEPSDRYVISLINIRKIHEFVLHHRQGDDVLIFHNCDTKFARLSSVRYQRNGKPTFISDTAFAENDFQKQLAFWFERMPGR